MKTKEPSSRKCKVDDCQQSVGRHGALGMCRIHYGRSRRKDTGPKRGWRLTNEQKDEIAQRYINGETTLALANEYGIASAAPFKLARRRGAPLKMNGRHIVDINHAAFSTQTEDSNYWVGFLMADGCVWKNSITLGLSIKDESHVEKFKNFMKSDHKIRRKKSTNKSLNTIMATISFKSKQIVADLSLHGVTPNKSLTARANILYNDRDFWRGVIDGDGHVSLVKNRGKPNYPKIGLCGSKDLLIQFQGFVHRNISTMCKATVYSIRNKNISEMVLAGKAAHEMITMLYDNSTTYLDRKYETAQYIMRYTPNEWRYEI